MWIFYSKPTSQQQHENCCEGEVNTITTSDSCSHGDSESNASGAVPSTIGSTDIPTASMRNGHCCWYQAIRAAVTENSTKRDNGTSPNETSNLKAGNSSPTSSSVSSSSFSSPHKIREGEHGDNHGFPPLVAFCFTINYILGTGFLTIPWAFVQGGLVLSCVVLMLATVASDMAKNYLLETMARAEGMLDERLGWIEGSNKKHHHTEPLSIEDATAPSLNEDGESLPTSTTTPLMMTHATSMSKHDSNYQSISSSSLDNSIESIPIATITPSATTKTATAPLFLVKERKFEVNSLCRIFLGTWGVRIWTLFLGLYVCGSLWAYTCVFSSAMARVAPVFGNDDGCNYVCYALIFGCFVVPLSCLELQEQVTMQVFLTLCRLVMLFLMLTTSHLCAAGGTQSGLNDEEQQEVAAATSTMAAPLFHFSGLYKTLPILVMANMYHFGIPALSQPVADKKKLRQIFTSTSFFTAAVYSLLGIVVGSAFGTRIEQSSNLNWSNFHHIVGGYGTMYFADEEYDTDANSGTASTPWWVNAIGLYVTLFPAMDVISAYPLNAISLGNNMFGAFYGSRIHEVENNRRLRTYFRLLASVPPILCGILVRQLGVIADYTGTTGFVIGFTIPALLYIKSKQMSLQRNFSPHTFYTSYASRNPLAAWLLVGFGIVMVVAVFAFLTFLS